MGMFNETKKFSPGIVEIIKFSATIVVSVVGVMTWLDGRFIPVVKADSFVKATRVAEIEKKTLI